MTRPDRHVVYPHSDAPRDTPHTHEHPAPRSLAEVVPLMHIKLARLLAVRVALVFHADACHRLSAILTGPGDTYREAVIPGSVINPIIVEALVDTAMALRPARRAVGPNPTSAPVNVAADQRLADAIQRRGPAVALRLVLYRAHAGTLGRALSNSSDAAHSSDQAA